jgi:mycothiol synthase
MSADTLPNGYTVRFASMDDVVAAVDLFNACEIAETGEPDYDVDELRGEWAETDPAQSVEFVVAPDGTLAGSMSLSDREHVVVEADGYVHPNHSGLGIGTFLVRRSEERAAVHLELAPVDAKVVLRNYVNALNPDACQLLEDEGYTAIRHFWRMSVTHNDSPESPDWPDGFTVRCSVAGQDEPAVYAAVEEAFQDHWSMGPTPYEDWLKRNTTDGFDPSLWFLAIDTATGEIAATSVCRYYGEIGWVRYLGVRRPWRRRGLGEALLRHTFGEFYRRGTNTVALGVDAESLTGATRLYERVGMTTIRRHTTYEKVLRDGEDWLTSESR